MPPAKRRVPAAPAPATPNAVTPSAGTFRYRPAGAPAAFRLPSTYVMTREGLLRQATDSKGNPREVPVCPIPLWLEGTYEGTGHEDVRIAIAAEVGPNIVRRVVPITEINAASRLPSLAGVGFAGLTSECARETVSYLAAALLANIATLPTCTTVRHAGPEYGDTGAMTAFVHGGTRYTGAGASPVELATEDPVLVRTWKGYAAKGEPADWGRLWLELRAREYHVPLFAIAFAGSSLLNRVLGLMPIILSLAGDAGGGKSVSVRLASSVAGDPDATVKAMRATENGMEAVLGGAGAMPLCLDETSSFGGASRDATKTLEQFVYMVSEGSGKHRMSRNIGLRQSHRWTCSVLVSGEIDLGATGTQSGVRRRVMTLFGAPFGYDVDLALMERISQTIARSHGHVARLIATRLLAMDETQLAAFRDDHGQRTDRWLRDVPQGTDRGMASGYSRTMAATEIVAEWIDAQFPASAYAEIAGERLTATRELLMRAWRHTAGRLESARRPERVLDVIRAYFAQRLNWFEGAPERALQEQGGSRDPIGKIDPNGLWVAMLREPLAQHLKAAGYDLMTDLEHLEHAGALVRGKDGKRTQALYFRGVTVRMVVLKMSAITQAPEPAPATPAGTPDAAQQVIDFLDGKAATSAGGKAA